MKHGCVYSLRKTAQPLFYHSKGNAVAAYLCTSSYLHGRVKATTVDRRDWKISASDRNYLLEHLGLVPELVDEFVDVRNCFVSLLERN